MHTCTRQRHSIGIICAESEVDKKFEKPANALCKRKAEGEESNLEKEQMRCMCPTGVVTKLRAY